MSRCVEGFLTCPRTLPLRWPLHHSEATAVVNATLFSNVRSVYNWLTVANGNAMRYLNIFLALLMLLFIAVQFNDPDGLQWMVIYLVPASWAAIAGFFPAWLSGSMVRGALILCILLALFGMYWYWPVTPGWWRQEVWWEVETAREGMGMMIVAIVLLVALVSTRARRGEQTD